MENTDQERLWYHPEAMPVLRKVHTSSMRIHPSVIRSLIASFCLQIFLSKSTQHLVP